MPSKRFWQFFVVPLLFTILLGGMPAFGQEEAPETGGSTSISDAIDAVFGQINGVLTTNELSTISPTVTSAFVNAEPVQIGAGDTGGNVRDFFDGRIDEVSMFNRALSSAEVKGVFDAGSAGMCKSANKVTICHKPGTPAQKTLEVSASALGGHLGHGDTIGPCE